MTGEDRKLAGRVWVHSMESALAERDLRGRRRRASATATTRSALAIELGAALLVVSNGRAPTTEVLELARGHGTAVIVSPLDTYVSAG